MDLADFGIGECTVEKGPELTFSEEWTLVERVNEQHNELLNSICIDRVSHNETSLRTEDCIVFQDVSLLPSDDLESLPKLPKPKCVGTLVITKHELIFADEKETQLSQKMHRLPHETDSSKLPLHMIARMDRNKQLPTILDIRCKDLRLMRIRFKDANSSISVCNLVHSVCANRTDFFAFHNKEEFKGTTNGWDVFDWSKEFFVRQGLGSEWKLVQDVNEHWQLCRTYPRQFVVPASVKPCTLRGAAKFRSHNRFPALCWHHPRNKATLSRCSQPMVGLMQQRSIADEQMVKAIADLNPNGKVMYIIDCRPWVNAYANAARGAGTEKMIYYPNCQLSFMNIDNIHTMRESFRQMVELCHRQKDYRWFSSLEGTRYLLENQTWLAHTSLVLQAAAKIARLIDRKKSSVLVHCSDGWDRTTQLVALAQVILDPYYRTIEGFEVLIEKEWLAFGHKFDCRSGHIHQAFFETNECSPIFLQFMDCVFQLMHQFVTEFEFNEQFLITIMDHVYSCKYGTFLYNNERQRVHRDLRNKTKSLWTYLNHDQKYFLNPLHRQGEGALDGICTNLRFWKGYYLRYHEHKSEGALIKIKEEISKEHTSEEDSVKYELEQMRLRLEQEAEARSRLERELDLVSRQKKELEHVMQGVQCTVYRSEGGEAPYLVAKIASPNRDLVTNFCDDLRNLHIIDDYSNSPSTRGCAVKAGNGRPRIKRRSASLLRTLQKQQRMVQNGDQNDDEHCYTKENEDEDEEDEWTLCETEEGTKDNQENLISKSPRSSYASEHTRQSNPKRSLTYDNRYRTPEEAAWALRDEVVTLELKNSTGSWILPSIRFSDYLETLRHYLKDHGFIPSFQWPLGR
jgi:myotubularin-related protein 1/2